MALVTRRFASFLKQHQRQQCWRTFLVRATMFFMNVGLWFFSLTPIAELDLLNELYTLLWIAEILAMLGVAYCFYDKSSSYTISGLVTSVLFLTKLWAHLMILLDTRNIRKHSKLINEKYDRIGQYLREGLGTTLDMWQVCWNLTKHIVLIVFLLTSCHVLVIWTTFKSSSIVTAVYWYALPSSIALQFKIVEFFVVIAIFNGYVSMVRHHLSDMGAHNLRDVFKMPAKTQAKGVVVFVIPKEHVEETNVKHLHILKLAYSEIYTLFQLFNECHGSSLLAFTTMYFIDLVCNTYWIMLALITLGSDNYAFIQNGCFVLIGAVQLTVLCWQCQESYDHSRYIGCLIYKLVKPLGNKRYNDLVSEFSLQILHQRFIITAKEFFNLNLNLLGRMVAAIVTYLVILIQFLYTEKNKTEASFPTNVTLNLTNKTT